MIANGKVSRKGETFFVLLLFVSPIDETLFYSVKPGALSVHETSVPLLKAGGLRGAFFFCFFYLGSAKEKKEARAKKAVISMQ